MHIVLHSLVTKKMANVNQYSNFIYVLLFGIIIFQVTSHGISHSPFLNTARRINDDFSITDKLTLVSNPPLAKARESPTIAKSPPTILDNGDDSALPPGIPTTAESTNSSNILPLKINTNAQYPILGVDHPSRILVKCRCKGDEILVDGQCQHYPKGTVISAEESFIHTVEVPVMSNYKVIIRDVNCDPAKSRLLQFSKEQFQLRSGGDLILLESADDLYGQRINDYCVSHHLGEQGDLRLSMKACVPLPATPRTNTTTESDLVMYCVDTYVNNNVGNVAALTCLTDTTLKQNVRPIVFLVCNIISLFFLGITITCYFVIPKLLKNGGIHQLCHGIALTITYVSTITVDLTFKHLKWMSCFPIAIMMQFGFLTTFFWLNVMCIENWREIRNFNKFKPYKSCPTWCYMVYAWGIPSIICVITVFMQLLAPEVILGFIKPYISYSSCWFKEDIILFIYIYGPAVVLALSNAVLLGLTHYNYKQMLANYKQTSSVLRDVGTDVQAAEAFSPPNPSSRHLTDNIQSFKQKLELILIMSICWSSEIVSWKIPPPPMWYLTDTLNSLQGLFVFLLLLSSSNKRKHLQERFPRPFKLVHQCRKILRKIKSSVNAFIFPVNSNASNKDNGFCNSTTVSDVNSSIKSSSNSSFSVGVPLLKA